MEGWFGRRRGWRCDAEGVEAAAQLGDFVGPLFLERSQATAQSGGGGGWRRWRRVAQFEPAQDGADQRAEGETEDERRSEQAEAGHGVELDLG